MALHETKVSKTLADLHATVASLVTVEQKLISELHSNPDETPPWPEYLAESYLAISPGQGKLLYQVCRAVDATSVIEFGTSFGISTLYLAAAVRDNGGGKVITTEIIPSKAAAARRNAEAAGLSDLIAFLVGDAVKVLPSALPEQIDLVFLDGGWDNYLDVLHILAGRVRQGGVVLADNAKRESEDPGPYAGYLREVENGFLSIPLSIEHSGMEFAVRWSSTATSNLM